MIGISSYRELMVFMLNTFTSCWNLMQSYWPLTFLLMLWIIKDVLKQAKKLIGK